MAKLGTMLTLGQISTSDQGVLAATACVGQQPNQFPLLHQVSHLKDPGLLVAELTRISHRRQTSSLSIDIGWRTEHCIDRQPSQILAVTGEDPAGQPAIRTQLRIPAAPYRKKCMSVEYLTK